MQFGYIDSALLQDSVSRPVKPTLSLEVVLDRVLLDLDILHDGVQAVDSIVQPRDHTCRSKLTEAEQQHETERLDFVVVLQCCKDTLEKNGQVNLAETCSELRVSVKQVIGQSDVSSQRRTRVCLSG